MANTDKFTLNIRVEIMRVNEHGGYTGDRLTTSDEFSIPVTSFTEIAAVLGQFHSLADTFRKVTPVTDGLTQ